MYMKRQFRDSSLKGMQVMYWQLQYGVRVEQQMTLMITFISRTASHYIPMQPHYIETQGHLSQDMFHSMLCSVDKMAIHNLAMCPFWRLGLARVY